MLLLYMSDRMNLYDSAKEHYILDIEDRELTAKAVEILERITPVPKKKAKKK